MTPDEVQSNPALRRALRVLRMIHTLHKLGYQRVREEKDTLESGERRTVSRDEERQPG